MAEDTRTEIREMLGFVPGFFESLPGPLLDSEWESFKLHSSSPLSSPTDSSQPGQAGRSMAIGGPQGAREDGTVESLTRLREQRAFRCRLSPDRALGSVEAADAFLRDRGLLTRTADCALPSLYEACHEEPYQPGSPGFATWPATRWPWFGELGQRGHLIAAVHRGKSLLVSGEVARLLDPICRAEITRMRAADRGWGRLLDHLAAAGPSSLEDLRVELGLKRQELKALRAPLERCGAIVSRSLHVTAGQDHQHSSELIRWDQAYQGSSGTGEDPVAAFRDLITVAVRAAVLAPETELRRWFSWPWYWTDSLVDDLIGQGRLRRIAGHVTVADHSRSPEAPRRPAASRDPARSRQQ